MQPDLVLARRGWVFTPRHFLDLASRPAITSALRRQTDAGTVRQLSRGLYDYRIDMVVEGSSDTRLAIECDGDEYHGPDWWQDDTKRQRVLERAGWTFWRCFASTWSLHRDDVTAELLERLGAMGIEPIGATDRVPSFVERREWAPPTSDNDSPDEVAETLKLAMATRLRSAGAMSWDGYRQWRADWSDYVSSLKPRRGGIASPVDKTLGRAGRPFAQLVLESLDANRITAVEASRYLDLRFDHIEKLRGELTSGAAGASAVDDGD